MVFARDTGLALQSAVELVNSAESPDTLTTVADLDEFWSRFGYTGRHDGDEVELAAVRDLRKPLRTLLTAGRDEAVPLINEMLERVGALPRLVRHDDLDWHLHVVDPETPLAERILAETAMAMIDVVRADEGSRLGVCAKDDCDGLVLDLSRNRSRIFCSTACGNRAAVAAYRARRR